MKIFWLLWISGVALIYQLRADDLANPTWNTALPSTGSLNFYSDICQFEGTDNKTLVEISYAVDLSQLRSAVDAENKTVTMQIQLSIAALSADSVIRRSEHKTLPLVSDQHANIYIDLQREQLKPGMIEFTLDISDSVTGRSGRITQKMEIRSFQQSYSLSDISFIRQLQKSSQQSIFEKNGWLMIPNPARSYFKNTPEANIYLYYEINHFSYIAEKPSYYAVHYTVTDLSGREIWSQIHEGLVKKSANIARVEKIPLTGFNTGLFKLTLWVVDAATEQNCMAATYFSVYSDESESRMVLPMSAADIQRYSDQLRYITTDQEKKIFRQLDDFGKQQFLISFWKSKDPDPATPQNEFMEEYFSSLAYCEKSFSGGLNSDMARIYITYGPPLEVKREPSFSNTIQSVETWIYTINGHTEFIFVDRSGYGQFVLTHSTHPDEYQNENWQNDLNISNQKE